MFQGTGVVKSRRGGSTNGSLQSNALTRIHSPGIGPANGRCQTVGFALRPTVTPMKLTPKGCKHISPGQRPGIGEITGCRALKGRNRTCGALSGLLLFDDSLTQGVAWG